jgi:hypothetical protein
MFKNFIIFIVDFVKENHTPSVVQTTRPIKVNCANDISHSFLFPDALKKMTFVHGNWSDNKWTLLACKWTVSYLGQIAGSPPWIILLIGSDNSKFYVSVFHVNTWIKFQHFVWSCVGCSTNSSKTYVAPCANIIIYLRNWYDILRLCNSQRPVNTQFWYLGKLSTSFEITWIIRMGTVRIEGA